MMQKETRPEKGLDRNLSICYTGQEQNMDQCPPIFTGSQNKKYIDPKCELKEKILNSNLTGGGFKYISR